MRWLFLVLSLTVSLAVPGRAREALRSMGRPPEVRAYDEAAQPLGFPAWGRTLDRSQRPHIILTLGGEAALLAFALPNRLTPTEADRWLNAVNDGLGWKASELRSYTVPSGTVLAIRGAEVGRPSALGRYRLELEVGMIAAQLRKLTPEPALLVVRGNAALSGPTPPPPCQGIWKGNRFLFYDLSRPASVSTLRVGYGISGRLQRATVALMVGWALFPTLVFSTVLCLLSNDPARTPKQQWEAYRRWLKPVWLATVSGYLVTLFLLLGRQIAYVLGPFIDHGHSITPVFVLFVVPSSWAVLPYDLVSIRLKREVSEKARETPVHVTLTAGIAGLLIVHALPFVLLGISWLFFQPAAATASEPPSIWLKLLLAPVFFGPPVAVVIGWVKECRRWRVRERGVPAGAGEAPPELTEQVRQFTAQCGQPINRVILESFADTESKARGALAWGTVGVLWTPLIEELSHEQLAALVTAAALSARRGLAEYVLPALGSGLIAWGLLSLGWLLLSALSSTIRPSTWQIVSFVGMVVSLVPLGWDAARALRRNERADLAAADLMGDPMAYVAALKHLETVRLQAMKLDTSLTEPPATVTMRRKRLERRLGLEP